MWQYFLDDRYILDLFANHPDELTIDENGDVDLSYHQNICFPRKLKIVGDLVITHASIKRMPEELHVDGCLDLSHTNISRLPKITRIVEGNLNIFRTKIYHIDEGVEIIGGLVGHHEVTGNGVGTDGNGDGWCTVSYFNEVMSKKFLKRVYFLREKILILKKLLEIPELYQEVYYAHKSKFISLLRKI